MCLFKCVLACELLCVAVVVVVVLRFSQSFGRFERVRECKQAAGGRPSQEPIFPLEHGEFTPRRRNWPGHEGMICPEKWFSTCVQSVLRMARA